ncbi:hypothetical protein AKO1_010739 [Acrasis kona]|uniref:ABCG24 n=1 Tax=Acrasis kona TaxID=1008807 RepID=A0AAW2YHS0_9EUKA
MVTDPYVLFLDEPTSGLDSASSKEVCESLQSIANSGITVVTVIHQPRAEIFDMFDDLLLLGNNGTTVYLGPTSQVADYFSNLGFKCPDKVNTADYIIDVCAGNVIGTGAITADLLPEMWIKARQQVVEQNQEVISQEETTSEYVQPYPSIFVQFYVCLQRSMIQFIRTLSSFFLDNILVLISGLSLATMFIDKPYVGPLPEAITNTCPAELQGVCSLPQNDTIVGQNGMSMLAMALVSSMASLRVFGKEKAVFIRESESGLKVFSYFWAKDIATLPSVLIAPLVFLSVFYTLIKPRASFWEYYYAFLLVYWACYGLGYCVSIVWKPHLAQLAAVVHVFLFNIFSGAVLPFPEIQKMIVPLNYLPYCSFLFYCYQTLYVLEVKYYKDIYNVNKSLSLMGFTLNHTTRNPLIVLLLGLLLRFAALFMLWCSKPDSWFNHITGYLSNIKLYMTRFKNYLSKKKQKTNEYGIN